MKVVYLALNAKYIHTSPAVRILYKKTKDFYDTAFLELTIKDSLDDTVERIKDYDLIGLSCYIWNIEKMIELSRKIQSQYPEKIVFAGGPEVSYEPETFVEYFPYVFCGEGETNSLEFLDYIAGKRKDLPKGIATKENPHVNAQYVSDMTEIPDILDTYTKDDMENRIVYVETNRGCPFNCSYCLSSVDKGVRFCDKDRTKEVIDFIKSHKFKCIKFLDRTFNVNPKRFLMLCKELEGTSNTYQFEIAADLFNDEIMDYFTKEVTKGKFRLEIGVQSLNDKAIEAVGRIQDSKRLLSMIERINKAGRATVHTDLIAGLPYEDLSSFKKSFDGTFRTRSEELQLGFLKLLRGTKIRLEASRYGYVYQEKAPYEVIENDFVSKEDLSEIHKCENSLEWMWNDKRCKKLLIHLLDDDMVDSYFDFFNGFDSYYDKTKPLYYNYLMVIKYLGKLGLLKEEYVYDLKYDYLLKNLVKPVPFWIENFDKLSDKKEYDYKVLGLNESYFNAFITDYYDKLIIIHYKDGPHFELYDTVKGLGRIPKRGQSSL